MGMLIALGIAAVFVLWAVAAYNGLVGGRNAIRNAWSQIDVQLRRRHDLVPNLVEAVKDAMDFEQEALTRVIEARNQAVRAHDGDPKAMAAAESVLGRELGRLLAVVEQYPELKAHAHVARLLEELTTTENRIGFARQYHNDNVLLYNNRVQMFPSSIIANLGGFKLESYLEIDDGARATPRVDLR